MLWHVLQVIRKPLSVHRRRFDLITAALLALLLFRAYVPVGFMPASGAPFLVELCPAGLSLPMAAHHHHADHEHAGHGHFEHCPFGSAPAAGPASQLVLFHAPQPVVVAATVPVESTLPVRRLARAHSPRGPPSLA